MKCIKTTEAVGHMLCHDLTRIVKGEMKGVQFKKGHIVKEEDIPMLLSMGKENLYVWEAGENMLHEDEAAEHLCAVAINDNMDRKGPSEGKIELKAACDGLFTINTELLDTINAMDDIMIAARYSDTAVKKGDKLAGMRVIPLVIEKEKIQAMEQAANGQKLFSLTPFKLKKAGIVTTGNEVYTGKIKDTFTPVVEEKLNRYGIEVVAHEYSNDDKEVTIAAINALREKGVDMVVCTGGMSVDPDDRTPAAIRDSGANIVTYGAPVLPGAMFLLGYYDDGTPVMGLPGCVMYAKGTVFDLILPRIAAGVKVEKSDIVKLGNGGLCLGCENCTFPRCGFGRG